MIMRKFGGRLTQTTARRVRVLKTGYVPLFDFHSVCLAQSAQPIPHLIYDILLRGNHLSNTTCLTRGFFELCANNVATYGEP